MTCLLTFCYDNVSIGLNGFTHKCVGAFKAALEHNKSMQNIRVEFSMFSEEVKDDLISTGGKNINGAHRVIFCY